MNPFGTTRQSVGGQNQYEPRARTRSGIVPFRPCRPPTPPWIIDWPVENLSKIAPYLLMFNACRDAALLQDPRSGMQPLGTVLDVQPQPDNFPSAGVKNIPPISLRHRWITWGLGTNAGTRSTVPLGLFIAPFIIRQITYFADGAASFPFQFNFEISKSGAPITESTVAVATAKPYTPILPELVTQSSFSSLPPGTVVGWPLFAANSQGGGSYSTFYPKQIIFETTNINLSLGNFGGIPVNAAGMIEIADQCTLEDLRLLMV